MLVVSRMRDDVLVIGDPANPIARITICDIRGDKVRLGVTADKSIPVHRQEIANAILAERKEAAKK